MHIIYGQKDTHVHVMLGHLSQLPGKKQNKEASVIGDKCTDRTRQSLITAAAAVLSEYIYCPALIHLN